MSRENEVPPEGGCSKSKARVKKPGAKVGKWKSYSPEFRLKAVLLHVEGGHSRAEVSRQLGVPYQSIKDWVTRFHRQGQGAAAAAHPRGVEKIVELKKENRRRGVRAGRFMTWR